MAPFPCRKNPGCPFSSPHSLPILQHFSFISVACLFAKSPQELWLAKEIGALMTPGLGSPLLLTFRRCWEPWLVLGSALQKWTISHCHREGRKQGGCRVCRESWLHSEYSYSCAAPSVNTDSPIHHRPPFLSTRPGERDDLVPAAGTSTKFLQNSNV